MADVSDLEAVLGPDWTGVPSDGWVESLVRRVLGLEPDAVVPVYVLKAVREWLRVQAARRLRARRLGLPVPELLVDTAAADAVREVLRELVASPYTVVALWAVAAMPLLASAVAEVVALRLPARAAAAPIRDYAAGKIGVAPWPGRQGRRRPYVLGPGDRRVPARSPVELGPNPCHVAAVNAASPAQVRGWVSSLEGSDEACVATLAELHAVGEGAMLGLSPLPVWQPEPGEPRGVWPPAEPVEPSDPAAETAGAQQPAPAPGLT